MDKMVETALPEDLESIGMRQLYNIELPGRMEQEKGVEWARTVENVEISAVACLGFPLSNPDVATQPMRLYGFWFRYLHWQTLELLH